jgi:hypothetical protein
MQQTDETPAWREWPQAQHSVVAVVAASLECFATRTLWGLPSPFRVAAKWLLWYGATSDLEERSSRKKRLNMGKPKPSSQHKHLLLASKPNHNNYNSNAPP